MKTILGDPDSPLSREIRADQAAAADQQQVDDIDDALGLVGPPRGA